MFRQTNRYVGFMLAVGVGILAAACGKYFEDDEGSLPNAFELPAKTELHVSLEAKPALSELKAGQSFAGVLAAPLYYRPEAIDDQGRTFERAEYLIAAQGAPVYGTVVEEKDPQSGEVRPALRLTSITLHGGKSFEVATAPIAAPTEETPTKFTFHLTEPADVALVIEQRTPAQERRY